VLAHLYNIMYPLLLFYIYKHTKGHRAMHQNDCVIRFSTEAVLGVSRVVYNSIIIVIILPITRIYNV